MTALVVERTDGGIRVGVRPPHPERTALLEARGAWLFWDVLDQQPHPAAEIFDARAAADWLWEMYGPDAAAAVLEDAARVETAWESPVLDAARDLAHLRWAEAWWPASYAAGIPALPGGLLRAEIAWRASGTEHLLDDEAAVERALSAVDLGALEAFEGAGALRSNLADLAEDYGAEPVRRVAPQPEDYALAAGGDHVEGRTLASGSTPVDWGRVRQGRVDAAAEAHWKLVRRSGDLVVVVEVPAAPGTDRGPLGARIGGAALDVRLDLRYDPSTNTYTGETDVPQGFLMLRAAERRVEVHEPGLSEAVPVERHAAIIAYARGRLTAPDATVTERAAGSA
jgi:hypothetical protein